MTTRALVHRVVIENNRATGVEFEHNKNMIHAIAAREVIVCGGAINSPQLLMLSGIGPSDHIQEHGIEPCHHLPGVGQNLQDHLSISVINECTKPVTFDRMTSPLRKFAVGLQWLLTRKGFVASNVWEAGGYIHGYTEIEFPNLQYHFAPVHYEYHGREINLFQGIYPIHSMRQNWWKQSSAFGN
jgi:choline dehydrogenase